MYQGSTTPSIYLPTVRYEPPPLRAFLLLYSTESSTGSRYQAAARRRIPYKLVLPKGLIAPYASNEAIKPLGSTSLWDLAARAACEGGSADHHGCAAVKKKRETKEI